MKKKQTPMPKTTEKLWKPEIGETYFSVKISLSPNMIPKYIWRGDFIDRSVYKDRNCFRTRALANTALKAVRAALKASKHS